MVHACTMKQLFSCIWAAFVLMGCNQAAPTTDVPPLVNETIPEKRCGESRDKLFAAYTAEQLAAYADCTILMGHFQEDSVGELHDLADLKNVHTFEGNINIFRSPGFVTLHGLENLEFVNGSLYIHMNPNLTSIRALGKLNYVTGNLVVEYNDLVPPSDLEWIDARVTVDGTKTITQ